MQDIRPVQQRLSFAARLFRETPPGFFGILASPNGPIYLDVLDALEQATAVSGMLTRAQTIEIISDVLCSHPEAALSEEFVDADSATASGRANIILRRLIDNHWLQEPQRTDYQRLITFDAHGEILFAALRQIAGGGSAQFTDKIQIACNTLLNPDAFVDQPLTDLEACLSNLQTGLRELRQMQKSIERYTQHLIDAESLREVHQLLFDEFSENIGRACYRELVRAQLPTKLLRARYRFDGLSSDEVLLGKLHRDLVRRNKTLSGTEAHDQVRAKLDDLLHLLSSVEPQANEIDDRTAEFARRSFARFRYLQEVTSGHRERVQELFEFIDRQCAGRRLSDLDENIELPALLIPEAGLLSGDSLYAPRLSRALAEIEPLSEDATGEEQAATLAEIAANIRDSLNVMRANRFVDRLPGPQGTRISSADMPIHNDEDIADLIACVLHAGTRDARFTIEVPVNKTDTAQNGRAVKAGYVIDTFFLEKK
jgi:hypothetical protein